jgi:hypothetical protein
LYDHGKVSSVTSVEDGIAKRHGPAYSRFKKAKKAKPSSPEGSILAEGFEEAQEHSPY